jgi:O-antigen ligase
VPRADLLWLLALGLVVALCAVGGLVLGPPIPLPLGQVVVAGVALIGLLVLTLWRYDMAVAIALVLLGLQRFEPAPVDGVLLVIIAVAAVTGRFSLQRTPRWVVATMGLFVALNLLSAMEAINSGRAAFYISITVYLCLAGLWVSSYVDSPRRARLVLECLIVVAVISAVAGTLSLYVHFPFASEMSDGERAYALFDDPNIYGPFLCAVEIVLLQELLEPRLLRIGWMLKTLLLAIITVGAFVSYSRAAWLNYAVGVAVLLAVLPLRRGGVVKALTLLSVLLIGVAGIVGTVVVTGTGSFVEKRARYQSYDHERFGAQHLGIEIAQSRPIGIGPGQFEEVSPVSAHSTYVRAAAEEGLLGFLLVAGLFFGTLLVAARNVIAGRDTAGMGSAGLLAVWCGTLANSVFIDTLHWRHLFVFAGLIWAGSLAGPSIDQASSSAAVRNPV